MLRYLLLNAVGFDFAEFEQGLQENVRILLLYIVFTPPTNLS